MKITRKKLRELIQEEVVNIGYKIKKPDVDDALSYDHPSDVKTQSDSFGGGANLVAPTEHLNDGGSEEKSVKGIEIYKIAESILAKIRKSEEIDSLE